MSRKNKNWLQEHQRDSFVKKAQHSKYRSRAVYKLEEIDKQDRLFHPGDVVVELGAAPGSWSQYVVERIGAQGKLVAVDILPMEPLPKVLFIKGDFNEDSVYKKCLENLPKGKVDLVISDMAPNLSGIRSSDQAQSMHLAELVFDFSTQVLKTGGSMLVKVFQGEGSDAYKHQLNEHFQRIVVRKPLASKDRSREFYIVAMEYIV